MGNFSGPLEARLLIRERFGAYSDATFRGDVEAWLANYADDGEWIMIEKSIVGKAALRAQWASLFAAIDRMAFFTEIGAINVDDDRATARSYCREIVRYKNGSTRKLVGTYDDELIRKDGVWLFAKRKYQLLIDERAL